MSKYMISSLRLIGFFRTLNLFSRDTYVVDQVLARIIHIMLRTLLMCAGIIAVIGASFPLFLVSVIPLGWIYQKVMMLVFSLHYSKW